MPASNTRRSPSRRSVGAAAALLVMHALWIVAQSSLAMVVRSGLHAVSRAVAPREVGAATYRVEGGAAQV